MNEILANISQMLGENMWLGLLLAFIAGILTSITPCALTSVTLIIGFVGGYTNERKKAFKYSIVFSLGIAVTFTILGVLAVLLGRLMSNTGNWWYIILGILLTFMTLQTWGIINILPKNCGFQGNPKKGYVGAFLLGIVGAIFASPCSTPVLIAILAIVASGQSIVLGVLMLLLYSIGHCILLVVAGTSVGLVKQLSNSNKFQSVSKWIKIICGFLLLLLAYYMFFQGFR